MTVVTVEINRDTILEVLNVTSIGLVISGGTVYGNLENGRLSTEKGFLVIQTIGLSKKEMRKYDLQEIDNIEAVPKEYMWNKIYGRENPSYVRYRMSTRYREKDVFFADGLDHKSAFYVLSKMKENPILAEKLK